MDTLTRTERSKRMALIRGKNTKPELLVRKIARACGYKFRLHVSNLPGKPDIFFPKQRKVIFLHGCFWPVCWIAPLAKIEVTRFDPRTVGKSMARASKYGAATFRFLQDDWSR